MIDFWLMNLVASAIKGALYAGGILLWNFGLATAPALPEHKAEIAAVIQQIPAEVVSIKSEIEILKEELAELKQTKVAAPAPAPKPKPVPVPVPKPVPVPVPAPIPVPVVVPTPAPISVPTTPTLPAGQFLTPSGAIVDAQGRLISGPPTNTEPSSSSSPTPPTPTPTPTWPPAIGSTVNIARYIATAIGFNSSLPCSQLGFFGAELRLCELYKNSQFSYAWVIVD